jgi:hypothetical protein
MTDLPSRVRRRGAETLRGLAGRGESARTLRARVANLEDEMQEARRLNRRLAELMDVVEELLVPLSQQDHERVERFLASNTTLLGGGSASDDGADDASDTGR